MSKSSSKESFSLAGRGILGGLVSSQRSNHSPDEDAAAEWIALDRIVQSPFQPRQFFAKESIESLAQGFKQHGFRGAVNVRAKDDGTYELVAGERRWRAAQKAQLKQVRCIVDTYTDEEALEFALMENLQREDLSKLEETEGILNFIAVKLGIVYEDAVRIIRTEGHPDKAARSDVAPSEELSKIEAVLSLFDIGLQTFRTKNLRTLSLPDNIKSAHLEKNLSYSSALELSKVKNDSERQALLEKALKENMSFRAIKEHVKKVANGDTQSSNKNDALVKRFNGIAKRVKSKSSAIKVAKAKRIEKLLSELEALISED